MPGRNLRWVAIGGAIVAVVVAVLVLRSGDAPEREADGTTSAPARDEGRVAAPGVLGAEPQPGLPPEDGGAVPEDAADPLADDEHNAWAAVDLDAVRKAMPDNVYWRMSSPTTDPDVLREREEERARWNEQYGKVLSNTATAEEIDAYYAHRDRLATDYVQFATYVLENYGEQLTIRDLGLLKVAVELNLARLEEIPRQIAEAHERRRAHEAAREAWRRDQREFGGADEKPR